MNPLAAMINQLVIIWPLQMSLPTDNDIGQFVGILLLEISADYHCEKDRFEPTRHWYNKVFLNFSLDAVTVMEMLKAGNFNGARKVNIEFLNVMSSIYNQRAKVMVLLF